MRSVERSARRHSNAAIACFPDTSGERQEGTLGQRGRTTPTSRWASQDSTKRTWRAVALVHWRGSQDLVGGVRESSVVLCDIKDKQERLFFFSFLRMWIPLLSKQASVCQNLTFQIRRMTLSVCTAYETKCTSALNRPAVIFGEKKPQKVAVLGKTNKKTMKNATNQHCQNPCPELGKKKKKKILWNVYELCATFLEFNLFL